MRSPPRFIPRQGSWGLVDYGHERLDANRGGGLPRGWGDPHISPPTSPQEQPFCPQRGTQPVDFLQRQHHQPSAASILGAGANFCHNVQAHQEVAHGIAHGGGWGGGARWGAKAAADPHVGGWGGIVAPLRLVENWGAAIQAEVASWGNPAGWAAAQERVRRERLEEATRVLDLHRRHAAQQARDQAAEAEGAARLVAQQQTQAAVARLNRAAWHNAEGTGYWRAANAVTARNATRAATQARATRRTARATQAAERRATQITTPERTRARGTRRALSPAATQTGDIANTQRQTRRRA